MEAVNCVNFVLPPAPSSTPGPVKAWAEPVTIPTYPPKRPDRNPMFLEKRVYQGSSGRVYPLPFTDGISTDCRDRSWQAFHLENEFLRVMILPETGGRIHVGLDKINGYDFFYRQNVIKPALVGLAGPWISGGVEFNWPQHHRPATFMPVDVQIEEHDDGSRTVWCGDHDPMNRLKGMHGVCLHPGRAYVELKVRLYNRTPFVQTFLWWANAAVRVHERYQSFFPADFHYVADHAKRATSTFPLCEGVYYGVDYGRRGRDGIPTGEMPWQFGPPGDYAPNDLSWYANIPVPTSYMALGSQEDFFGGYDHRRQAGFVHVANHHIAPGKKQWTWGNHEFGYAWDRNLTDADGPYIELMAGVYTDNQPDFSFLAPGETKIFSQLWYPIQKIGPVQKANTNVAVSLLVIDDAARVGVCVTRAFAGATVRLEAGSTKIGEWVRDLAPGAPVVEEVTLPREVAETELALVVYASDGGKLIRYHPRPYSAGDEPQPAREPLSPKQIKNSDELYLTGLHIEQYRHATWRAEDYWREALRRDPGDARSNNAMGLWHLRRGEFAEAEECFRNAIQRLTSRNPNPYDGEPHFNLGLALRFQDNDNEAYAAFYKATWNYAWRAAGYQAIAELDAQHGDWNLAWEHLGLSLRSNADNLNARNLAVVVLRKLDRTAEADALLKETLAFDPLDVWARYLNDQSLPRDNQTRIDLALDHARAGLYHDAIAILSRCDRNANDGSAPMVLYALCYFHARIANLTEARTYRDLAAQAPPDYCFPSRLEELIFLKAGTEANAQDARAFYYLGNLLYDRRRHREAMTCWERSSSLDPSFPTVWRNLGIGYFNVMENLAEAARAFDKALKADPTDARVLYERDQLWKRVGEAPERRLAELERFGHLVRERDDLSVELAGLYNQTGKHEKAHTLICSRKFQPWEGGEGLVRGEYVRSLVALGRRALAAGDAVAAVRWFGSALASPDNLGEARHMLSNQSDVHYWMGVAYQAAGYKIAARHLWTKAATAGGDFRQMAVQAFSETTYYKALALEKLGRSKEAEQLLRDLLAHARSMKSQKAQIDYFATSLPAMLLFDDDLQKRNLIGATLLEAQARLGLKQVRQARRLLRQVLELDRNHALAADLTAELEPAPSPQPAIPA
jgi:tetratricopeptide (TPR) repeat protein